MAKIQDITVPEPPKKGSDWTAWLRWGLTIATVLISWYATWSAAKEVKEDLEKVKIQLSAK